MSLQDYNEMRRSNRLFLGTLGKKTTQEGSTARGQLEGSLTTRVLICGSIRFGGGSELPNSGSVGSCQEEDPYTGRRWRKWLMRSFLWPWSLWIRVQKLPPVFGHTGSEKSSRGYRQYAPLPLPVFFVILFLHHSPAPTPLPLGLCTCLTLSIGG